MWPAADGAPAVAGAHTVSVPSAGRRPSDRQAPGRQPGQQPGQQPFVALQPVSHPELAPIEIHDSLFAIGRNEAPFDSYPRAMVADLSRRHARIFCEDGAVYLADLGSKNGTTVNGVAVCHAITLLRTGDQLGLGRALAYRVQLEEGALAQPGSARLASLTLTPARGELGLQPIVVTEFPFMISKVDATFARYQDSSPTQVNYLSRRHAHIFLKAGQPYLEDLGSTNGSFVDGARLDEHAVPLRDGVQVGFGGHHFVYRVGLHWEAAAPDPTMTRLDVSTAPGARPAAAAADADRTTFVAAPDSFLDIFCVDQPAADNGVPAAAAGVAARAEAGAAARPHGKALALLAAFSGQGAPKLRTALRWCVAALVLVALAAWSLYRIGAPERDVEQLLARGAYARAAAVAGDALARDPGNPRLTALASTALLKANVPPWIAALKARQFPHAAKLVAAMRAHAGMAATSAELAPLLDQLDWIARLEQFVAARGGAQAPVKDANDAARIDLILKQWEEQNQAHQRAFETLSSYVPAYRDAYADALSDVRKLALARGEEPHEPATP